MAHCVNASARRYAGQPPTAPFCRRQTFGLKGGGFSPACGPVLPFELCVHAGSGAALTTKATK